MLAHIVTWENIYWLLAQLSFRDIFLIAVILFVTKWLYNMGCTTWCWLAKKIARWYILRKKTSIIVNGRVRLVTKGKPITFRELVRLADEDARDSEMPGWRASVQYPDGSHQQLHQDVVLIPRSGSIVTATCTTPGIAYLGDKGT